jgi:hypothetical protein
MKRSVRLALAASLIASSLLAAGCGGPSGTAVSGKLLENGEPIKPPAGNLPPGDKGWKLSFAPADGGKDGVLYHAVIDDDGSFRVSGPNDKGIPPGKYRITVLKGAMGSPRMATIQITDEVEIPRASSVKIEVDAGKKTAKVVP